jgi:hypothetical protein
VPSSAVAVFIEVNRHVRVIARPSRAHARDLP